MSVLPHPQSPVSKKELYLVFAGLMLALTLASLNQNIVSTARRESSANWASNGRPHRVHRPTVITYPLCAQPPKLGENWDGARKQPRLG